MKLIVDTHIHTISSGHAYSTIVEMAQAAKEKEICMIAMTDHAPFMEGAPSLLHFVNLRAIPGEICGVKILKGVEANIVDYLGRTDMPDEYLEKLDFVIASLHDICIKPSTVEQNTNAIINVLKNPYIDTLGHPGNPAFPIDIEKVVMVAREYNKPIEINNVMRSGSKDNCREIARTCKRLGTRIVCGSDAHISFEVGKFEKVYKLLDELDFPEHLAICSSMERFLEYLAERKERIKKFNL